MATTFKLIMNTYSNMREFNKAETFEKQADRLYRKALGDDIGIVEVVSFNNLVGDIAIKKGGLKALEKAAEVYSSSSKILHDIVGENGIDFILSLLDIGDIHLEKKEYEQALSFYTLASDKVTKTFGEDSIFHHRINSSLVELYASKGDKTFKKCFELSMKNIEFAQKLYGEESLYCLSYYLSGISSAVQQHEQGTPSQQLAEELLAKMMKVLESTGEIANGN